MSRARRFAFAPLALVALLSAGCHPYIRAAGKYADATKEATAAIDAAPGTASRLCRTKSQMHYLDIHVGGAVPEVQADAQLAYLKFYDEGHATKALTWKAYCADIDKAGEMFSGAAHALGSYGAALAALAKEEKNDQLDLKPIVDAVAKSAGDFGASSAGAAIKPAGALLQALTSAILAAYVEGQVKSYVTKADPVVQDLVSSMEAYAKSVDEDLAQATEKSRRNVVHAFEKRLGLIGVGVEPGQTGHEAKLLEFYHFAAATEDDLRATQATLKGYREVLAKMKKAHATLKVAAQESTNDKEDLKKALTDIADLIGQISALQSALNKKG